MPGYRIEEKIAGTDTWRPVDHLAAMQSVYSPGAIREQAFGTGRSRTIYSTMRAAAHDCREIHDKNGQDQHRVVTIGLSRNEVTYWIIPASINLDLDNRARVLRRDLVGTPVTDEWESPSERDLHVQSVLNVRRRL